MQNKTTMPASPSFQARCICSQGFAHFLSASASVDMVAKLPEARGSIKFFAFLFLNFILFT